MPKQPRRCKFKRRRRAVAEVLEPRNLLAVLQWAGDIPDGTIWGGGDIHHLTGDINIPSGASLTVEPGAVIKLGRFSVDILVRGNMIANGTESNPIVFTEIRDDVAGDTNEDGASSSPARNSWGRIEVANGGAGQFNHAEFRYGGFNSSGQVTVNGGELSLQNSLIEESISDGLRIQASNPLVHNNRFRNNAGAAASMDLASNPDIQGVVALNNAINGLQVDAGTISANAFWNDADIAYWIDGDVTVSEANTLTIGAGQVVKLGHFSADLTVDGALVVNGTSDQPVVFTERDDDTVGGDTNNDGDATLPAPNNWGRIELRGAGNSLNHVDVRYGGFNSTGLLTVNGGELTLSNSTLQYSTSDGLRIQNSDPVLKNTTFLHNVNAAASMDLNSNPEIRGVVVANNAINGLQVDAGTISENAFWNDADIVYWIDGDISVAAGNILTVGAGQIVKLGHFSTDLVVDGALVVNGTSKHPVVFTERDDDTAGGDTNNDADATAPAPNNWGRIELRGPGNTLNHVDVRYGGFNSAGQLTVNGGELTLNHSTLRHSTSDGLRIQNSDPVLTNTTFLNNVNAAASMDLNSNPDIRGVIVTDNAINGLQVDAGTISENAFWNDADIVYWIDGDVTVAEDNTLTVGAGQVVKLGHFSADLVVDGSLVANGTSKQPVVFTERDDDSVGGDTNNDADATVPAPNNWGRIELRGPNNVLKNVDIRYGGFNSAGQLTVNAGQLTLSNSTLRHSNSDGLRIQQSDPTLNQNVFFDNNNAAVSMDLNSSPTIRGVVAKRNAINGLQLDAGTIVGDRTWDDPDITYWLDGDTTVAAASKLTISAGQVIKFGHFSADLLVAGTLIADGTTDHPIVFTERDDDTVGGDTNNDGQSTAPGPNNWGRVEFQQHSVGNRLDHVEVRYGGFNSAGMVQIVGAELAITNSVITKSNASGVALLEGSDVTILSSVIHGNAASGIRVESGSRLVATNNTLHANATGVSAEGNLTRASLQNSLVTEQTFAGITVADNAVTELMHNNFLNPGSSRGNYNGIEDLTGDAGNISIDPRYVGADVGDFRLQEGSPVVDAGQGTGAPPTDHIGNLRVDDPDVINTGSGIPDYVDLGAFELDRWLSQIDAPLRDGEILLNDTLWFGATGLASPAPTKFNWNLSHGKSSRLEDPGYLRLNEPGPWHVTFQTVNANNIGDPSPDLRALTVIDAPGPHPDLSLSDLSVPDGLRLGGLSRLTYEVTNVGGATMPGGFVDAVYVSDDPRLDLRDVRLAETVILDAVPAGQGYAGAIEFALPDDLLNANIQYLIVSVDDTWQTLELHQLNNERAFETVAAIPELQLGQPIDAAFAQHNEGIYYRVQVEEGHLSVDLNDLNDTGINELYLRYGSPPLRSQYDLRYTELGPDQRLIVPNAFPGTWYLLAVGSSVPDDGAFTILADASSIMVESLAPDRHGNTSDAVVTLTGAGFTSATSVELIGSDGEVYPASSVQVKSFTTADATFLAGQVPGGIYTVRAHVGDTSVAAGTFEMVEGGIAQLVTNLVWPDRLGYHQAATLFLEYENVGDMTMAAPLVSLVLEQDGRQAAFLTADESRLTSGFWTTARPDGFEPSVQVLAHGKTPGILRPGESGRVPIYYVGWQQPWDFSYPPIESLISVADANNDLSIDWTTARENFRPDNLSQPAWDALWTNFIEEAGTTWSSFVDMLGDNASYLASLGQTVTDLETLARFELQQSDGAFQPQLEEVVDATGADPTSGALTFSRSFPHDVTKRYYEGSFGRGWTHNWDIALQKLDDGTVLISVPGESRVFQPDLRGGYFRDAALGGQLRSVAGGGFTLIEQSGTVYTFSADGKLERMSDRSGADISLTYEGDLLTRLANAAGADITLQYNAAGMISSVVDPQGRSTTYTYDPSNEYLISSANDDSEVIYDYVRAGDIRTVHALTSVAASTGATRSYEYNARGHLARVLENDALVSTFDYGTASQVTVTGVGGAATRLEYDHGGYVGRIVDANGGITTRVRGADGVTTVTNPAGHTQRLTQTASGEQLVMRQPNGTSTTYGYNSTGEIISIVDSEGRKTTATYDDAGRITGRTHVDGTTESVSYDENGQVSSSTNRRGQEIAYDFDDRGLLTSADDGAQPITIQYDESGAVQSIQTPAGSQSIDCDDAARTCRVTYTSGQSFDYAFDELGRTTSVTDHLDSTVIYAYAEQGGLESVTRDGDLVVSYAYNDGVLNQHTLGNGVTVSYDYDATGRLTQLTSRQADGAEMSATSYEYDRLGNVTIETSADGVWNYEYDSVNQLTQATFASSRPDIPNQELLYRYDGAGNREAVVRNGAEESYETNELHQYTQAGGDQHVYDLDGNLLQSGTATYEYDAANRLTSVDQGADRRTIKYGPGGDRTIVHNDETTVQITDPFSPGRIIAEYDGEGNLIRRYDHGLGLVASSSGDSNAFYVHDGAGNTQAVLDEAGQPIAEYEYTPFGTTILEVGSRLNPFKYAGQWGAIEETAGSYFSEGGYFDTELGRLRSDPVGTVGGYIYSTAANFLDRQRQMLGRSFESLQSIPGHIRAIPEYYQAYVDYNDRFNDAIGFTAFRDTLISTQNAANDLFWDGFVWAWDGSNAINERVVSAAAAVSDAGNDLFWDGVVWAWDGSNSLGESLNNAQRSAHRATNDLFWDGVVWTWDTGTYLNDRFHSGLRSYNRAANDLFWDVAVWAWDGISSLMPELPTRGGCQFSVRAAVTLAADHEGNGGNGPDPQASGNAPRLGCFAGAASAVDPNQKLAIGGFGDQHWVSPDATLSYQIDFENYEDANAPAQIVTIVDQLSEQFDWDTLEFTEVGFGDVVITVPPDTRYFAETVQHSFAGNDFEVQIQLQLDPASGLLSANFFSIDPATGFPPAVEAGFLPPEDGTGRGLGHVSYIIKSVDGLASGSEIRNIAEVTFDFGQTIATNQVEPLDPTQGTDPEKEALVTIDAGRPSSEIASLPGDSPSSFLVEWSGDDGDGSGVAGYDIYVSDNGAPAELWLAETPETSATFRGLPEHTYRFFSVAVDNVGYFERAPDVFDAQTTTGISALGDFNGDGKIDAADIDALFAALRNETTDAVYDVNNDGSVDGGDTTFWIEEIASTRSGDANLDGEVSFADFLALAGGFGLEDASWSLGDFNGDGKVSFPDFLELAKTFGYERPLATREE